MHSKNIMSQIRVYVLGNVIKIVRLVNTCKTVNAWRVLWSDDLLVACEKIDATLEGAIIIPSNKINYWLVVLLSIAFLLLLVTC